MLVQLLIKEEGEGKDVKSDTLLDLFKIISKCVMLQFFSSQNQSHWLGFIVLFFFFSKFKGFQILANEIVRCYMNVVKSCKPAS